MATAVVLGAMKAGTTTLYHDMSNIPGVSRGPKESGLYSRGRGGLVEEPEAQVTVDFCADYSMAHLFPGVAQRVEEDLGGDVPLVYMLRDPLERLESHLRHLSSLGEQVQADALGPDHHVVLTSRYGYQVRQWLEAGHRGLHLVDFHQYSQDRVAGLAQVAELIGAAAPATWQAGEAQNASSELRSARPLIRGVVRSTAYQRIKPFIPANLRSTLKQTRLTEAADTDITLAPETRKRLRGIFVEDLRELEAAIPSVPEWVRAYTREGC